MTRITIRQHRDPPTTFELQPDAVMVWTGDDQGDGEPMSATDAFRTIAASLAQGAHVTKAEA